MSSRSRCPLPERQLYLLQRALAVIGVDKFDVRFRRQFLVCEAERPLPGWIEPLEVASEVEAAEHVDGAAALTMSCRRAGLRLKAKADGTRQVDAL